MAGDFAPGAPGTGSDCPSGSSLPSCPLRSRGKLQRRAAGKGTDQLAVAFIFYPGSL